MPTKAITSAFTLLIAPPHCKSEPVLAAWWRLPIAPSAHPSPSSSPSESSRHGVSCDDQLLAHHPEPALPSANWRHPRGGGSECDQASQSQCFHNKTLWSQIHTWFFLWGKKNIRVGSSVAERLSRSSSQLSFLFLCFRVMIHVVAQCHEEGLEHYLRSYVKVRAWLHTLFSWLFICQSWGVS